MNFGHLKTSLEVEDCKVYDVCGRHQDLEPMSQYNKSQKGDQKGKALWELTDEKYPIDRVYKCRKFQVEYK